MARVIAPLTRISSVPAGHLRRLPTTNKSISIERV